jgi:hypothetical protein
MSGPPKVARSISSDIECLSCFVATHAHLPPLDANKRSAGNTRANDDERFRHLQRHRTRKVRQAIVAVRKSRMEYPARTKTEPAMAPAAAAVTPLANALIPLLRENRR